MAVSLPCYDYPELNSTYRANVRTLCEEQLARQLVDRGLKVVSFRGRYWQEITPGFFDGLHWLSRHAIREVGRPEMRCWGYRAALLEEEASSANGAIPVHLLTNLRDFTMDSVPSKSLRGTLRRFHREGDTRLVHVTDHRILADQGYDVMMSALIRIQRESKAPSREVYLENVERLMRESGWLVVAGVKDDTLLGYMTSWSVGRTAYLHELFVRSEALNSALSAALYVASAQVYRMCGDVDEVCAGLHLPEKPSLGLFKERLGFTLARAPSRVFLPWPASVFMRLCLSEKHYRLTGRPCSSNGHSRPGAQRTTTRLNPART